jgi:tRNA-modifying protein YgfZ
MNQFWSEYPREFAVVRGPDALTYLHSQISQDIRQLGVGSSAYSFVLQPAGKIEALVRVNRTAEEEFVLDVDPGFGERLMARLSRFKIRVKADLETVQWRCIAVRNTERSAQAPGHSVASWGLSDGYDLIGATVEPPAGIPQGTAEQLLEARVLAGWPAMGSEITDASIPAETGVVDLAVNFTKGCYPGQELVERMDSRGSAAPRFVRSLRSPSALAVGDELFQGPKLVGQVSSVAVSLPGHVALAVVARSVEPGSPVSINGNEVVVSIARLGKD